MHHRPGHCLLDHPVAVQLVSKLVSIPSDAPASLVFVYHLTVRQPLRTSILPGGFTEWRVFFVARDSGSDLDRRHHPRHPSLGRASPGSAFLWT